MIAAHPEASRQAVVEAALVLLERMRLTPADLATVPQHHKSFVLWARAARKPVNRQRLSCCDAAGSVVGHDGFDG